MEYLFGYLAGLQMTHGYHLLRTLFALNYCLECSETISTFYDRGQSCADLTYQLVLKTLLRSDLPQSCILSETVVFRQPESKGNSILNCNGSIASLGNSEASSETLPLL